MTVKIGIQLPRIPRTGGGFDVLLGEDLRSFVRTAEATGYSYLQHSEHVLGADVSAKPNWHLPWTSRDAFHEPFVTLGYLAGITTLELTTSVLVLPQRQTVLAAKQAAHLDLLSGQRLRLGVAIGRNDWEYRQMEADFRTRAARLEEQVTVLRRLWTEDSVTFEGRFHQLDAAALNPRPNRRIPIWMGGGAQPYGTTTVTSALERVGRLADGWISLLGGNPPVPRVAESLAVIRESAERAGRDPASVGIEGAIWVGSGFTQSQAREQIDYWTTVGATHVSVYLQDPGESTGKVNDQVREVADWLQAR